MFNVYIKDIKKGDHFWECEAGMNDEYVALEDASLSSGGYWSVRAEHAQEGYPLIFAYHPIHSGAYAPKLYTCRQYATPSDL